MSTSGSFEQMNVTIYGKGFEDMIKLRILRLSWSIRVAQMQLHVSLKGRHKAIWPRQGRKSSVIKEAEISETTDCLLMTLERPQPY
jgi:hypothetical protein